jgi:hypothetical protein
MFSQAPILVAARGMGRLNMVSSFNASVLISVMLFCTAWNFFVTLLRIKKKSKKEKKRVEIPRKDYIPQPRRQMQGGMHKQTS